MSEAALRAEEAALRRSLANDPSAYDIRVNRTANTVTVYAANEDGVYVEPVRAMLCSTGGATPAGEFKMSVKYPWRALFGNVFGQYATRIVGNILFHSVPYKYESKDSLKYEEYNKLGTSASMGCIRLTVEDAKWIYDYCAKGTRVVIYDDAENPGALGKPEVAAIDVDSPNRGWDPTDPDARNPWRSTAN
jgi:lipoprotein-anchoring transpeptidase ErfK/SrfK